MFRHATRYTFGSAVFLRGRDGRRPGLVTQIALNPGNATYQVSWCDGTVTHHYDFELLPQYVPDYAAAAQGGEG